MIVILINNRKFRCSYIQIWMKTRLKDCEANIFRCLVYPDVQPQAAALMMKRQRVRGLMGFFPAKWVLLYQSPVSGLKSENVTLSQEESRPPSQFCNSFSMELQRYKDEVVEQSSLPGSHWPIQKIYIMTGYLKFCGIHWGSIVAIIMNTSKSSTPLQVWSLQNLSGCIACYCVSFCGGSEAHFCLHGGVVAWAMGQVD